MINLQKTASLQNKVRTWVHQTASNCLSVTIPSYFDVSDQNVLWIEIIHPNVNKQGILYSTEGIIIVCRPNFRCASITYIQCKVTICINAETK